MVTSASAPTNPYLSDNFSPIRTETQAEDLTVVGTLPEGLRGTFYRIGPNPQFDPIGQYHWFDGDGMVHAVQLEGDRASYRNRWVRTKGFQIEREEGRPIWTGLMEPPQMDAPHGMVFKNVANTALMWHGDRLLALWEGGQPHQIDPVTLETVGAVDFNGGLTSPFTAHPKRDPQTNELFFIGYRTTPPFVTYGIVSPESEIVHTQPIEIPQPVMMHDFAITENHAVFLDVPMVFNFGDPTKPPMYFSEERGTRFGIMPRQGAGAVRWFKQPSCTIYHVANAYDEGDTVVLYACRHSKTNLLTDARPDDRERAYLTRWTFDLNSGEVTETAIDAEMPTEFPQIDPRFTGCKTRYVFAAKDAVDSAAARFDGIVRYDLETGDRHVHQFEPGCYGGETMFAPKPGSDVEGDGWLLTYVHDTHADRSELQVFAADNLEAGAIARVMMPQRVPYGFHAFWLAGDRG